MKRNVKLFALKNYLKIERKKREKKIIKKNMKSISNDIYNLKKENYRIIIHNFKKLIFKKINYKTFIYSITSTKYKKFNDEQEYISFNCLESIENYIENKEDFDIRFALKLFNIDNVFKNDVPNIFIKKFSNGKRKYVSIGIEYFLYILYKFINYDDREHYLKYIYTNKKLNKNNVIEIFYILMCKLELIYSESTYRPFPYVIYEYKIAEDNIIKIDAETILLNMDTLDILCNKNKYFKEKYQEIDTLLDNKIEIIEFEKKIFKKRKIYKGKYDYF